MVSLRAFLESIDVEGSVISLRDVASDLDAGPTVSLLELIREHGSNLGGPSGPELLEIIEPGPDIASGQGMGFVVGLGLGDKLVLRKFTGALFPEIPHPHEPIQGWLGNCPLIAVLCAMAHVPAQRARLQNEIVGDNRSPVVQERASISIEVRSHRQRQHTEYFVGDAPSPLPTDPTSGFISSARLFLVKFDRKFGLGDSVTVSPVLLVNTDPTAGVHVGVHYARASTGALWPSIIEKAYAIGRGGNSYNGIATDVGLAEAMRDLTGEAVERHLFARPARRGEPPPPPPINDDTLRALLQQHDVRPIILGSFDDEGENPAHPDGPPHSRIKPNHTYAVVGFPDTLPLLNTTLIDALEETPASREITMPLLELRENFGEIVLGKRL